MSAEVLLDVGVEPTGDPPGRQPKARRRAVPPPGGVGVDLVVVDSGECLTVEPAVEGPDRREIAAVGRERRLDRRPEGHRGQRDGPVVARATADDKAVQPGRGRGDRRVVAAIRLGDPVQCFAGDPSADDPKDHDALILQASRTQPLRDARRW